MDNSNILTITRILITVTVTTELGSTVLDFPGMAGLRGVSWILFKYSIEMQKHMGCLRNGGPSSGISSIKKDANLLRKG